MLGVRIDKFIQRSFVVENRSVEYIDLIRIVLDPFCGSGSTGIGALLEGRKFYGIELEEEYASISKRRLQEHVFDREVTHE